MLYLMRCDCGVELDIGCPANQYDDIIKPGIDHVGCHGILRHVITPSTVFSRGPFPATGNEIQLPTPHFEDKKFMDKIHAREWLGERGLTSKWIEDDM